MMGIGIWMLVGAISVANIETPPYEVVHKEKDYEVRTYAPQIVAEVTMDGEYRDAMSGGFRTLADFIFGNNKNRSAGKAPQEIAMTAPVLERKTTSAKIAMTAPVLERMDRGETRVIAFVMPRQYTMDTIPTPNNPKVQLRQVPPKTYAVLRFSGWVGASKAEQKKMEFAKILDRDQLQTIGPPILAQYNPPWTPPFMRRNEILVELAPRPGLESLPTH